MVGGTRTTAVGLAMIGVADGMVVRVGKGVVVATSATTAAVSVVSAVA